MEEPKEITEPTPARKPVPAPSPPVGDDGLPIVAEGEEALEGMSQMSRRSFLVAGLVTAAAVGGLWFFRTSAPEDGTGIKTVFRDGLMFNEGVAKRVFFADTHKDTDFPRDKAVEPPNNYKGATPEIELADWKLSVAGMADGEKTLTLADLKTLPETSQTTELKCVEGWSKIVNWSGVRFKDFAAKYPPPPGATYVAMRSEPEGSEDEWYYVGLDLESCLHPQTLLAWSMNGEALNSAHGAPLRLVIPHKYGIKNIKLITHIAYGSDRPKDYWAEQQGYDYYAGL